MRKQIALVVCAGAVVLAAFLRHRDIWSWFWATENVGTCWFITGIWLGKVNLARTHAQLIKDEMSRARRPARLSQWLINCGMGCTLLAVILHFVAT